MAADKSNAHAQCLQSALMGVVFASEANNRLASRVMGRQQMAKYTVRGVYKSSMVRRACSIRVRSSGLTASQSIALSTASASGPFVAAGRLKAA